MSGFGGAGAFSDGKYNITNDFGGTLYEYIGREKAISLMKYVDEINCAYGGAKTHMYSTANTKFKKICMQNKLTLLDASVRHLGTDINYVVLENLFAELKDKVDFYFQTPVDKIEKKQEGYKVLYKDGEAECTGTGYREDREECSFIWDNYYDEDERINEYELTLFVRDEEQPQLYRKYQEEHFQRAYTLEQIRHMLTEAGLEYVTAYDDYTKESPHDRSERICVVAREHGKGLA